MTKFDFSANRQQVEKQYNLGKGEYFKVKDGDNKVRLVSECLPHPGEYKGKPTFKWLCQVVDLTDNKVKPYFMPDGVYKQICSLQTDPDYSFEEVPMPYNINIVTENAGDLTAKYQVRPSPKHLPLTPEQEQAIKDAPTVTDLQKKIRESDAKNAGATTPAQAAEQMTSVDDGLDKIASEIPF